MDEDKLKQEKPFLASFKRNRGNLDRIYSDERTLQSIAGSRKAYYDVERTKTRDQLLLTIKENLNNPTKAAEASEVLVASNGVYASIIDYYTNIPLYRYTIIPSLSKKMRENIDISAKYGEVYNRMISVADGISMEVTLPKILQQGLIYGIIYMYLDKDKSSETVETFLLPYTYCRKGFTTNFGTDTVVFDFKFFDDIKMKIRSSNGLKIVDEDLYDLFPAAMVNQYMAYLKDTTNLRWQQLDPKFSAAIPFSPNGMPPKFSAAFGLVDYDLTKTNEMIRSSNELEKIMTHEIPHTADGDLMFDFDEALELHESMTKGLSGVKGLKLLTTFGATQLVDLQKERTKENKALQQAYANIFYNAGMNPQLFDSAFEASLKISLQRDAAYIFKQLDLIINFYNLAVNNLYNFSPYEMHINLLHISNYDEAEKVTMYVQNANFGIGKLEAVVATGIKQKDIGDKHELEQFLQLDKILVPLQSAYTSTPNDQKPKEDEDPKEEEVPEKEPVEEGN